MEPLERLRTAGKRVTDPLEQLAQRVAERAFDIAIHALDINELVAQLDLNAVLDRIDVQALLSRVDLNALLEKVALNALIQRIDVEALVAQTDFGDIIAKQTRGIASGALDAVCGGLHGAMRPGPRRRSCCAARLSHECPRVVTGNRAAAVARESLQGDYCGVVSRLAAFALDLVISSFL